MEPLVIRVKRKHSIIITEINMYDLHTHILPGIDDGAKSLEEALKMTEELAYQGIKAAVCTPHFNARKIPLCEFLRKRNHALSLMKDSKISLISGSEVELNDYLFHYPDLSPLCIEDTKYILIEPPFTSKWDKSIYDMLEKLVRYYSLYPIIAHVERYPAISSMNKMKKLIDLGCYLQVNSSSILTMKSWHRIARYIKHGYIDVISSDCHNLDNRPPILSAAYEKIEKELGEETYLTLKRNAEDIIKGKELREKMLFIIN